ncbi:MAG: DeoR family transcriptional regulator [Candidatus Pacebacteria bacterium]|nr:DeoR family transcriptional regulator [Candidatus Paceibacterota bacterium]
MSESGKERFILTKSYEIAYALFRIAAVMLQEKDFSERLRAAGAGFLEAAAVQDYAAVRRSLQAAECLVKFAGDLNLMGSANADTLLREIYVLDAAVIERINAARMHNIDLAEIFSKPEWAPSVTAEKEAANERAPEPVSDAARMPVEPEAPVAVNGIGFIKAEIRQTAILDRIRQSGNCRMKDLQDALPGCSERTIRYDLQSLLEQSLIERIGNGGPSVFYRMRQPAQGMPQEVGR